MLTAPADWYLASVLGIDPTFHRAPRDLLAVFGRGLDDVVTRCGTSAISSPSSQLTRMLAVRGVATGVAGTTACLSGVEHLVSHMLDMHNGAHGRPIGLHGAQVGVASVVAAAAWEHLFADVRPGGAGGADRRAVPRTPRPSQRRKPRVLAAFADLDPPAGSARNAGATTPPSSAAGAPGGAPSRPCSPTGTATARPIDELLVDSRTLGRRAASRPGAAARFAELDPSVDDATARWAVAHCHLMRNRFTVVDLLDLLGRWTPDDRAP